MSYDVTLLVIYIRYAFMERYMYVLWRHVIGYLLVYELFVLFMHYRWYLYVHMN